MPRNPSPLRTLALCALLAAGLGAAQTGRAQNGHSGHQGTGSIAPSFAERERQVMPFDLDATLHVFRNRPDGGLEDVTAKSAGDRKNIGLIRSHLKKEAAKFAKGDFSDPAYLHGASMAGLAQVRAGARAGRIRVAYSELPTGARLRYTTADPALVKALHAWFAAQVGDHGGHATTGR